MNQSHHNILHSTMQHCDIALSLLDQHGRPDQGSKTVGEILHARILDISSLTKHLYTEPLNETATEHLTQARDLTCTIAARVRILDEILTAICDPVPCEADAITAKQHLMSLTTQDCNAQLNRPLGSYWPEITPDTTS